MDSPVESYAKKGCDGVGFELVELRSTGTGLPEAIQGTFSPIPFTGSLKIILVFVAYSF